MRVFRKTAVCLAVVVLWCSAALAGTVSIEVVPQDPDIGDAVGIIAHLTLDPGQTCTKMECRLKDLTCGYERGPFTMFQDSPTRWHGNWQTLDGHNGPWEIKVTAYFSTYNPPGSSQATAVKLVDVGNLVLDDLEPDRPILWTNDTTDLPPAFSCYVFNHVPLPVGMELQIYDTDYGPRWGKSESVSPNTTWSVQPPAGALAKYHIYTYKFWGQQNYADWYTNPRPIFNSLSATLDPPFDPDTGLMCAQLAYRLSEQAALLNWQACDPLLDQLAPSDAGFDMPTGPPNQTLTYEYAGVWVGMPWVGQRVYGGRYHWVVSGMASKMERDHRLLPIKDEGAAIVMQPIARNFSSSGLPDTASVARDAQLNLVTEVPDGQYGATASWDPSSDALMQAFEKGAIVCFDGHGMDHEEWVREGNAPGPADPDLGWVETSDGVVYSKPPPNPPPDAQGPNVTELLNAHQCHLAVFYTCYGGDEFQEQGSLPDEGVDCVVAPADVTVDGGASDFWFPEFWRVLRTGGTAQEAIDAAKKAVKDNLHDYEGTDTFTATAPTHRIVEPPKSAFYK